MTDESVEVAFPFVAADSDQISLVLGETIAVVKKLPTGWWIGRDPRGHVGGFPAAYTRPVKVMPKFSVPKENKTAMLQKGTASNNDAGSFSGGGGGATGGCGWSTVDQRSAGSNSAASSLNTSLQTGGGGVSDAQAAGQQQHHSKNYYSEMSKGDTQQLRHLLGLDDDEDDGPSGGGGGGGGAASSSSEQQYRHNLERILASSFENTAGNHRSLRDGQRPRKNGGGSEGANGRTFSIAPLSSVDTRMTGGGSGAHRHHNHRLASAVLSSSSSLVEQVISMRKEISADAVFLAKLSQKESVLENRMHAEDHDIDDLKRQVVSVKNAVQHHQCLVADLEQRIEVLRCVVEGGEGVEVPAYDPKALARQLDALLLAVTGGSIDSTQVTPSSSPRYPPMEAASGTALSADGSTDPGQTLLEQQQQPVAAAAASPEPPTEAALEEDPVAKKLIRKLNKRIVEAEDTRDSYTKQKAKLTKRITKFKASIKQVDEEIQLLRNTLSPEDAATATSAGSNGATATATEGGGYADDCASSAAMSDTDDYASLRERSVSTTLSQDGVGTTSASHEAARDKLFRKLLQTLTDEEQGDIEKYQLAEIKLQQKSAKLKEQVEGDSAEVAGLRTRIEKLKRLLGKGDQALQLLLTERSELQSNVRTIESTAVDAAKSHQAALTALAARRTAVQHALAKRNAAVVKQQQDREALTVRIAKEHQRCADFEEELAKLVAKANALGA